MATTFEVDSVKMCNKSLPVNKKVDIFVENKLGRKPIKFSHFPENLHFIHSTAHLNSLIQAVDRAYHSHYPLVLSPDTIWQCVAQGFAIHVNKNAEKLRHMFVDHKEKKTLEVQVEDDFVKGSPDADWEHVVGAFSEEIRKNIGDEIHDLLTPDFSTTGSVERVASQVVLMNTFTEFFDYMFGVECGIPSITLEGTVEDWKKLREKTLSLSRFDFQWWTDAVKPILDEFVNASSGVVHKEFWHSLYKISRGCGGPFVAGWIVTLFPYLESTTECMRENTHVRSWNTLSELFTGGIVQRMFPSETVSTPFTCQSRERKDDMYFYAGFLGVGQDKKSLALKPIIGWAVANEHDEVINKRKDRASCICL